MKEVKGDDWENSGKEEEEKIIPRKIHNLKPEISENK